MSETKRKISEQEEIEVNLEDPEPLSKKQKRLQKKGKTELSESKKRKLKKSQNDNTDLYEGEETAGGETKGDESDGKPKKSEYSVWIGNLTYETSKEDIRRFLTAKSEVITRESISRINLPGKPGKCKGFAYVDFNTQEELDSCIELSELNLAGRNLLIKNAKSYEGRPEKKAPSTASRILFVGNLSFDTTESDLEYHFQHCGEIVKIRMATFEDSGNCKGFSFVDFMTPESATKAMNDKRCKKLHGRNLRMEYGEDRSKRSNKAKHGGSSSTVAAEDSTYERKPERASDSAIAESVLSDGNASQSTKFNHSYKAKKPMSIPSDKPGLALANAQRGKVSIAPASGKKVTFD